MRLWLSPNSLSFQALLRYIMVIMLSTTLSTCIHTTFNHFKDYHERVPFAPLLFLGCILRLYHFLNKTNAHGGPMERPALPLEIIIEITGRCRLVCPYCTGPRSADVPLNDIKATLDEAASLGIKAVRITGGEPLIHPDIRGRILTYAKAKKFAVPSQHCRRKHQPGTHEDHYCKRRRGALFLYRDTSNEEVQCILYALQTFFR